MILVIRSRRSSSLLLRRVLMTQQLQQQQRSVSSSAITTTTLPSSSLSSSSSFTISSQPRRTNVSNIGRITTSTTNLGNYYSTDNPYTNYPGIRNNTNINNNISSCLRSSARWQSSMAQQQQQQPQQAAAAAPTGAYDQTVREPFPSLIIGGGGGGANNPKNNSIQAVGSFAEAQAMYLHPDEGCVDALVSLLRETNMGIVAHYYMDVELQGVLQAAAKQLPPGRIGIADSLKMGDMAVDMVREYDCPAIACLGVDFMSESVSAILNQNGYGSVPVYRATPAKIGCSLAESAERESYRAWLQTESAGNVHALHVIYINTSLETKAVSSSIVPTITCTSSNVLQTLLTASAQIMAAQSTNWKILYGPDTYMGDNLVTLLDTILKEPDDWDDAKIAQQLHPHHTRATLQTLRDNIRVYPHGNCVVHHMFGHSVVETVKTKYDDCYVTAHLEVPGEMFEIAMSKSLRGNGVVGSTSDILNFITKKVQEEITKRKDDSSSSTGTTKRLQFILGTEAGMVTSIVQNVQRILNHEQSNHNTSIEAEIIFPVASDAVTGTDDGGLVPGVAGGEGCSTAGGCATCPFMKMNNLDALMDVLEMVKQTTDNNNSNNSNTELVEKTKSKLMKHLPPDKLRGKMIDGRSAIDLGTQPIAYMRSYNKNKLLPNELLDKILLRTR